MDSRVRPAQATLLALLALAASLALVTGASGTAAGPARATDDRIDPRVLEQIAAQGQTTFWVLLRQRADLSRAQGIQDWGARGRFVHERLTRTADASQSGLRSLLRKRGVPFEPFWIVNAIRVTAGESVVKELAAQREVERIIADGAYRIQKPERGSSQQRVTSIEWGIDRIRASLVWSTFGVRGENIVVANIDTGVQYNHPALVGKYRGNQGGSFDHNYNWYDPSRVCGSPSLVPCDNNSHGTHTMGTMVGDDGAGNQIGVAPGARWIAAKGCESNSCSFTALLSSGQWVLAPTKLDGTGADPTKRPNIVNNSWGGGGGDPFYQDTVNAWVASGIFPAFSNGNSGPGCGTSGSPGDYVSSYSAGAFDSGNNIASFSSRGPSSFSSEIKPNIAAPGVSIRSSVPTNSYSSFSGTSMASPHVAGTVALIWSAAPSLLGQIALTGQLLDNTAIDTANTTCGGTTDDNNVWGEGRLDAFAAVDQSPRGPAGTLEGTVTAADGGSPIEGATVEATGTTTTRTTSTDALGRYSLLLPVGSYGVTVRAFGRLEQQTASPVQVNDGATTTLDFALVAAPSYAVSGTVKDSGGAPIPNATVTILNTPLASATTDATGYYIFSSVPEGTYDVRAEAGRCTSPQTNSLIVNGAKTLDFTLAKRTDTFGYSCSLATSGFILADSVLSLTGDDNAIAVGLPFSFSFYGQNYSTAYVSTNGLISFTASSTAWSNSSIPSTGSPNGAVYGFWDDLIVDSAASIRTKTLGSAGNRQFVVEWRNVHFYADSSRRISFEIVLNEDGSVLTQYADIASDGREQGNSATVGIENPSGSDALQYSYGEPATADGLAVLYSKATGGGGSPTITTSSLADGTTGVAYSQSLAATGGMPPYSWDLAPGSDLLPPGLRLSASGVIDGTPTTADTYSFTVMVTDSALQSSKKALSIDVGTPVDITTTILPDGIAGQAYSQTLAATDGTTPYRWSIVSGSLPPGLLLDSGTGTISGTPTTAGSYGFTVQVTDSATPARTNTQALEIVVAPGLAIVTPTPLSPCKVGAACPRTIEAVGGASTYTWSLVGGSLPPGLTWDLASTGPSITSSGAPTKPGNYNFTVQVTDSGSPALTATKAFSLKINKK
ncbi:MAG TPA: S8 family serine peptidase [Gaiellaceae bacterium]|nr:S8 family serine peptidase [Gaiellaceae bacterium]HLG07633.1 S8 family serine peptidase [Gaiellaceae bacterium]